MDSRPHVEVGGGDGGPPGNRADNWSRCARTRADCEQGRRCCVRRPALKRPALASRPWRPSVVINRVATGCSSWRARVTQRKVSAATVHRRSSINAILASPIHSLRLRSSQTLFRNTIRTAQALQRQASARTTADYAKAGSIVYT